MFSFPKLSTKVLTTNLTFFLQLLDCTALGAAGPPPRILPLWRALFERSELRSHPDSGWWTRDPQGRARANMVLAPFAETKGPRRAGPTPRIECSLLTSRTKEK